MFWKTKSSAQLPVFVARGYETPPKTTDGSQADVQPSQPASNFEGDAQRILEGEMAEIWLASSSGTERPAAQLVALAAQACREVAPGASAERLPDESVFTERLNSLQVLIKDTLDWTCQNNTPCLHRLILPALGLVLNVCVVVTGILFVC